MVDDERVKKIANLQKHCRMSNRKGTKGYIAPEAIFNCKS